MPNRPSLLFLEDLRSCLTIFCSLFCFAFGEMAVGISDSKIVKGCGVAMLLGSNSICVLALLRNALSLRAVLETRHFRFVSRLSFYDFDSRGYSALNSCLASI